MKYLTIIILFIISSCVVAKRPPFEAVNYVSTNVNTFEGETVTFSSDQHTIFGSDSLWVISKGNEELLRIPINAYKKRLLIFVGQNFIIYFYPQKRYIEIWKPLPRGKELFMLIESLN